MRIGVFAPPMEENREHYDVLRIFGNGVRLMCGEKVTFTNVHDGYVDCDVAVVFGIEKYAVPTSKSRGDIIRAHRSLGRNVIVIDTGYVHRDRYYMVGWNGLNGRADFNISFHNCQDSSRADQLGVTLQRSEHRSYKNHYLLIGQVPWDAAVQDLDHIGWLDLMARRLAADRDRSVVFRPHPKAPPECYAGAHLQGRCRLIPPSMIDLESACLDACQVVTQNSNVGVDASILGVSCYVGDPRGSMIAGLDRPLHDFGPIDVEARRAWFNALAFKQWTVQEMAAGLPWRHLTEGR